MSNGHMLKKQQKLYILSNINEELPYILFKRVMVDIKPL